MTDQNQLRNDDELLESIRKTQERMKEPEGINYREIIRESWDNYWIERELSYGFARVILGTVHRKDGWWSRLKMERSFKSLEDEVNHLQSCPRCKEAMKHVVRAIDYLKIAPMIVTLEDGEEAIRYLAKHNDMTEDEFRACMSRISGEVIREMNSKDKAD